ncbi:Protein of unknown function [Halovenus aranensis]|jgi:hypothetical protein|uniref:DUF3054 domain-containing protein n=1 Tax=Halovenus aranensis TaxID=890420 RepID=A0A1G8VUR4_9EURY|nr:DUF3054 domain-containing protein [Halovenus aranensis]SDJ68960.1 Protein of unknown function [Halovenus aranensis]
MSNTTTTHRVVASLTGRVPTTTGLTLLAGDLVALFAFVVVGQYKHGYLFWEYPSRTVLISAPLVCSWLVAGVVCGLATAGSVANYRRAVLWMAPVWLVVAVVGGVIRRTTLVPGYAPPSFFIVSILFGWLFLGGWRLLAAKLL